jgi:hypothetical protein
MKPSTLIQVSVVGGLSAESPDQDRRDDGTRKIVERYARQLGHLSVSGTIQSTVAAERVEVAIALARLREAEKRRAEAEARMKRFLRELGYRV